MSVRFILDTDHLQYGNGQEFQKLLQRMSRYPDEDFGATIITLHEQLLGAHTVIQKAKQAADLVRGYRHMSATLAGFLKVACLDFDTAAAAEYDVLRKLSPRVRTMDLRIAAIARSNSATLLTRNLRDFTGIPSLDIENWLV